MTARNRHQLVVVPFPVDPQAAVRARAADRRIVDLLGPSLAVAAATNASSAVFRAALMLRQRHPDGRYVWTAGQVAAVIADWHANRRPSLREARRG